MWYHSLKTRQSVKRINTRNSSGTAVALEYIDKKVEVHHLSVMFRIFYHLNSSTIGQLSLGSRSLTDRSLKLC